MTSTPNVQALLDQTSWMRELARKLVSDPHRADDLTQEAWLAALEHQPHTDRSLRGWLATVLRNLVRQGDRGDSRRSTREQHAAREEATASTLDLLERVSVQRQVADAVTELEEPYRTVLLLRFFEGLRPLEIAHQLGLPVSTVKTRLSRGLARLRERLDREHGGDGRAWVMALVPLTKIHGGPAASFAGALVLSTQLKVAAAAVVVAAGIVYVWPKDSETSVGEGVAAATLEEERSELADASDERGAMELPAEAREPAVAAASVDEVEPTPEVPAPSASVVRGRVLSTDAMPLSAVPVSFRRGRISSSADDGPSQAISGSGGRFELDDVQGSGVITAAGDDYATVYAGHVDGTASAAEPVVVVAPRLELAGRVVDEAGRPLPDTMLEVVKPDGFHTRFGEVMDYSIEVDLRTQADADGRFELSRAFRLEGATLRAERDGYVSLSEELPVYSDKNLVLTLRRRAVVDGSLTGQVVDDAGNPVPDARVAFGVEATRTDDYGLFAFELEDEDSSNRMAERWGFSARRLMAVKEGFLPARLDVQPESSSGELVWPEAIVLRLSGEPLSIAGRVVDSDNTPLAGIDVWVNDTTLLSMGRRRTELVENVLAGAPDARWRTVSTGTDGSFEIGGLLDREYSIAAMDPTSLLRADSGRVAAGTRDLTLVLDDGKLWQRVAGRVVDRRGNGIAGASVAPMCDGFRTRYQGQVIGTSHGGSAGTVTDEDGRFELERVPKELVYLRIDGEDILSEEFGRTEAPEVGEAPFVFEGSLADLSKGDLTGLEITVALRVHLKVELGDSEQADEVGVLDGAGEAIVINVIKGTSRRETERVPLVDGSSDVLTVTDGAETLLLLKAGEEVRRVPLELVRGEVNVVRP